MPLLLVCSGRDLAIAILPNTTEVTVPLKLPKGSLLGLWGSFKDEMPKILIKFRAGHTGRAASKSHQWSETLIGTSLGWGHDMQTALAQSTLSLSHWM